MTKNLDSGQQPQHAGGAPREEWKVRVLDAVTDEPRELIIAVSDTRVVVVTPPGAGYVVPPQSIGTYRDALRAADNVAERRKRGYRTEQPP
ncbi:hypothetical protein [Actinophytocola sp.]|uniref:hypothetical protein n=1 Tax=Actinophytocola sp. TaxID=1872138 RepID=UPI002ED3C315